MTYFAALPKTHFDTQFHPEIKGFRADLDMPFLERMGLNSYLDEWRESCAEQL